VSTALDYWTFAQMLANGGELDGVRILSPATIELMFRDRLPRDSDAPSFVTPAGAEVFPGHGFGLGFAVLAHPEVYGVAATPGVVRWGGLLGTMFFIDPDKQIVAVLLSQQLQRSPDRMARAFQALVYQALAE
jgi:CubicO group peptidase (beta-lactamase class C family)